MYTGVQLYQQMKASSGRLGAATMATVLVIDDDGFVRASLEQLLQAHGYEVITASGGQEALERIEREAPDLVLTDLRMPGMDGLEVLRRAKGRFPHSWHQRIQDDQIGTFLPEGAQPLLAVLGGNHLVAFGLQDGLQALPDVKVIVHDQNFGARGC